MAIESRVSAVEKRLRQRVTGQRPHWRVLLEHNVPPEYWTYEELKAWFRDTWNIPPDVEISSSLLEQLLGHDEEETPED
jgi:hypothetical protein